MFCLLKREKKTGNASGGYRWGELKTADGPVVRYRLYDGNPDIAPVLCLHGLTRNSRDFEELAPMIAEATGRRVIVPEMRGRVIGCFPLRCTDSAHQAGQWRTPSADEGLALAADIWMFGAADAALPPGRPGAPRAAAAPGPERRRGAPPRRRHCPPLQTIRRSKPEVRFLGPVS